MKPVRLKPGDPAPWFEYDEVLPVNALRLAAKASGAIPAVLWHYTNRSGLIGILESKALWASDVRFLNDAEEFRFGIQKALGHLEGVRKGINSYIAAGIQVTAGYLAFPENYGGYVCSFSEERDSLSLWRAYGHDGRFAIGLRCAPARADCDNAIVGRCLYESDSQSELVQRILGKYLELSPHADAYPEQGENHIVEIHSRLSYELSLLAPIFKHPTFKDEREWRIIVPAKVRRWQKQSRPGRGSRIPYIEIPFDNGDVRFSLAEVMVGPMEHADREAQAVRDDLGKKGYSDVQVSVTESPYRDW